MLTFAYKTLDSSGRSGSGTLTAANRAAAMDCLAQQGLIPVAVEEMRAAVVQRPAAPRSGRVPATAAETFIRELSNLLAGGVSLSRAMHILARETSNSAARQQWTAIHDDVVGGMSLADAMSKWPATFTPVQVAMVRAGETGGFLDVVLSQIADFRARERDLKGKVKGAMIYPLVLATLSCAVVIFLLTYFIPRFSQVFESFKATLPPLTLGIMAASNILTRYGPAVAVAVVLLAVLAKRALRSEGARRLLERAILKVPAVGAVLSQFALVRFCRMLGTLLGSAVPLVASLRVAREALGNQTLADAMALCIEEVQRGTSLARSLGSCPALFPGSVTEVIAVAE